jgi:hypothetical protein
MTPDEEALLERVARRVVELRLELPAILTLETARPVSFLAGQALTFFAPFVQGLLALPDYDRFARLLERRETLEVLTRHIETLAEVARSRPARAGRPDA